MFLLSWIPLWSTAIAFANIELFLCKKNPHQIHSLYCHVVNIVFHNINRVNHVNCDDHVNGITSTLMLKLNHLYNIRSHTLYAMAHVLGAQ